MKKWGNLLGMLCMLLAVNALRAQTFTSTVNQAIPDNNTTQNYNLTVSGLPTAIDTVFGLQTVCININHTRDADLYVRLVAPDGTVTLLFNNGVGGTGANFASTCFTSSGTPIGNGAAPFTGLWQSQGMIGEVNLGQNPNGVWQLKVKDVSSGQSGTMLSWSLNFGANPANPAFSSNLPIVKLTTIGSPMSNDPKVPVRMQVIDNGPGQRNYSNSQNYVFDGTIMAEWQGYTGPTYPKKNYDFEVVDGLGQNLDTTLLGLPREHDWIFKAEYLDHALIKNMVTYEMARRMGVPGTPRTRMCELVVDKRYNGYFSLTEKIKRDANRVDISKLDSLDTAGVNLTGGYMVEMNINGDPGAWNSIYPPINNATCGFPVEFKYVYPRANVILPVQGSYIHAYIDSFENVMNSPTFADPVTGYRNFVKISSFIDFLIVNEYSVNYDSYGRSTYLYKDKSSKGGKMHIGPPWDYDRAMDYTLPGRTSGWVWQITHNYWPFPFWWSKWWTEQDYRKQLACRWTMLRQTTLSNDSFAVLIDSLEARIDESAHRNFAKWLVLGTQTYSTQVDSVRSYLTRRLAWMDMTLAAENVAPPVFYLPTDTVVCAGAAFDAGFNGSQFAYNWQPGPDTSQIRFDSSGTYNLLVTDQWGCYDRKSMNVVISVPDASFAGQQVAQSLSWTFTPTVQNASSYSWQFGDGGIDTQVNPLHTYLTDGSYLVSLTVTDSIGCVDSTSDTIQFIYIGLQQPAALAEEVYPNPFDEKLQVMLEAAAQEDFELVIQNEAGQTVLRESFKRGAQYLSIPTSTLAPGVYLLRMQVNGRNVARKLVKS